MKNLLLIALALLPISLLAQSAFISEIHYDNSGPDEGEAVEVTIPANYTCSSLIVYAYNGSNGTSYANRTITFSQSTSEQYIHEPFAGGLQNGAPDGLALVCDGTVLEFISYEGSFTATSGPANGLTSTDIGVSESSSTPIGHSLQKEDAGWQAPKVNTFGALNANTSISTPVSGCGISSFGPVSVVCNANTSGTDAVTITVPYVGIEDDATLSIIVGGSSATNSGDNPATVTSGTISFTANEGDAYTVSITDADSECSLTDITGSVSATECPEPTAAKFEILSQFVNPCGNDGSNEFIIAKTTDAVNIANLAFGSAQTGTVTGGTTEDDNFNFWWNGTNIPNNAYDITGLSNENSETVGSGNESYDFAYPSVAGDKTIIDDRISQLNTAAGCTVFLPVPTTNIIPTGSNVIVLLGAFHCNLHNVSTNLNFSNHCGTGTQYYVVVGKGDGGGGSNAPCTNPSSGYFSNTKSRTSYSLVHNGGPNTAIGSYSVGTQKYTPGSSTSGNAGIATPGTGGNATWTHNEGCVPPAAILTEEVATPMPVELLSFTARTNDKVTDLTWTTATEENNSHFEVEWSLDGKIFKTVGKVTGNGNTTEEIHYLFTHKTPLSGVNYYRLKQIDFDGAYEYSKVAEVKFNAASNNVYIRPTIATDKVELVVEKSFNQVAQVQVVDVTGKIVMTSTLVAGETNLNLNIAHLANGHYFVKVAGMNEIFTTRFIKK